MLHAQLFAGATAFSFASVLVSQVFAEDGALHRALWAAVFSPCMYGGMFLLGTLRSPWYPGKIALLIFVMLLPMLTQLAVDQNLYVGIGVGIGLGFIVARLVSLVVRRDHVCGGAEVADLGNPPG